MITAIDLWFSNDLYNKFDNVLDGPDDIHYVPENLAISRRRKRFGGDLNLPFISVWREPFNPEPEWRSTELSTRGRLVHGPDGQDAIPMKGYPFEVDYEINYWDNIGTRGHKFNFRWLRLQENDPLVTIPFEVQFPAGVSEDNFTYEVQTGQLVDNSDIEQQHDHGADIRYTGDLTVGGNVYEFDEETTQPPIEKILIDTYVGEFGDRYLVDEIVVE